MVAAIKLKLCLEKSSQWLSMCHLQSNGCVIVTFRSLSSLWYQIIITFFLNDLLMTFYTKGCVIRWFSSYLENRTMQVCTNRAFYSNFIMQYRLLKGLVIGPLDLSFTLMLLATFCIILGLNIILMLMIYKYNCWPYYIWWCFMCIAQTIPICEGHTKLISL